MCIPNQLCGARRFFVLSHLLRNSYNALDNYALVNNLTVKVQEGIATLSQEYLQIQTRDEIFVIKQLLDLYNTNADLRTIIYSLPKENQLFANFSGPKVCKSFT